VREHGRAVGGLDVLDELDAVTRAAQQARELALRWMSGSPRRSVVQPVEIAHAVLAEHHALAVRGNRSVQS